MSMSTVHGDCKSIITQNVKELHCELVSVGIHRTMRLWQEKFFISCSVIKVKFGANNFADKLTPLKAANVSLSFTVQLLLLNG